MKRFVIVPTLMILTLIPLWAALGMFKSEMGKGGDHSTRGHGDEGLRPPTYHHLMWHLKPQDTEEAVVWMESIEEVNAFIEKVDAFVLENTRPDGCVEPGFANKTAKMEHGREVDVVYLQAFQFGFRPQKLCLESGKAYMFVMMATDVTHGASIHLGQGSKMVRLPPRVSVMEEVTFTEPGEYLRYCSFYCGAGHAFMFAQIIVESEDEPIYVG